MIYIDDVIVKLDTLADKQRATQRVIAHGIRGNAAYAPAFPLNDVVSACGLECDRVVPVWTAFLGFAWAHLVARVKPVAFAIEVNKEALPGTLTAVSTARAAAEEPPTATVRGSQLVARAA